MPQTRLARHRSGLTNREPFGVLIQLDQGGIIPRVEHTGRLTQMRTIDASAVCVCAAPLQVNIPLARRLCPHPEHAHPGSGHVGEEAALQWLLRRVDRGAARRAFVVPRDVGVLIGSAPLTLKVLR